MADTSAVVSAIALSAGSLTSVLRSTEFQKLTILIVHLHQLMAACVQAAHLGDQGENYPSRTPSLRQNETLCIPRKNENPSDCITHDEYPVRFGS